MDSPSIPSSERLCRQCGVPIVGRSPKAVYCGKFCANKAGCAAYRAKHLPQLREYFGAYRQANREKVNDYNAVYRAAHPEKRRESVAAYLATHPDRRKATTAKYNAKNRAVVRARTRAQALAHPEKYRAYAQTRHAKKRNQFIEHVDETVIYERDQGICHICRGHVPRSKASMDHLVPISLGGLHAAWNIRLAHRDCNSGRCNRGPAQLLLAGVIG